MPGTAKQCCKTVSDCGFARLLWRCEIDILCAPLRAYARAHITRARTPPTKSAVGHRRLYIRARKSPFSECGYAHHDRRESTHIACEAGVRARTPFSEAERWGTVAFIYARASRFSASRAERAVRLRGVCLPACTHTRTRTPFSFAERWGSSAFMYA